MILQDISITGVASALWTEMTRKMSIEEEMVWCFAGWAACVSVNLFPKTLGGIFFIWGLFKLEHVLLKVCNVDADSKYALAIEIIMGIAIPIFSVGAGLLNPWVAAIHSVMFVVGVVLIVSGNDSAKQRVDNASAEV